MSNNFNVKNALSKFVLILNYKLIYICYICLFCCIYLKIYFIWVVAVMNCFCEMQILEW